MTNALLSCSALAVTFGRTAALAGVDLEVSAAEVVAVMGASGSGKSTLLHCLAGILRPDEGEVHFAGERIDHLSERERSALRRQDFGFVFQFGELVPELTLAENVALPLRLAGLGRRTAEQRARELLTRLEVAEVADKRASEVSGGQAQRVAVARALVHRPRVVFADEPTGALDSANGELVLDALCSLARDFGSAVVLVTHEPRIAAFADREIVMRNGAIAVGSVA
ncbi:ABC transporter ATP-binding protein [Acidothermaceae bacterium B102]|nr:ABC transporter ATP-binding protein [Acidothermaceae bacterium B102]